VATDIEASWKLLFQFLLQFISEYKSEQIITIGSHLPRLLQKGCMHVLLTHGMQYTFFLAIQQQA